MPSEFPTPNDLEGYLTSLGVLEESSLRAQFARMNLRAKTRAAQAEWERDTGYRPFLKDGADVSRYFDAPDSRFLDLEAGLLTLTSLTIGYSYTSAGTALTANQEFYLWPYNAAALGQPYTGVQFTSEMRGGERSIVAVGRWGYSEEVPDDVWQAVLERAAAKCQPEIALQVSRGAVEVRTQNTGIKFADPLGEQLTVWQANWDECVGLYARVSI